MAGTGVAQLIPILVSPILTRIYSPADFGAFALFIAVSGTVAVAVTGRYELAILLPKQDRDAIHVFGLAVLLSVIISVILLVLIAIFHRPIVGLLGGVESATWLYWTPLSTLLIGVGQSLYYWSNRKGNYSHISFSRALQSGGASGIQVGAGFLGSGFQGLLGGQVAGQVMAIGMLAPKMWLEERHNIRELNAKRIFVLGYKFSRFPKYLIAAHVFNASAAQIPNVLINGLFSAANAGVFFLTQRVLGAPMNLVACAIGDVFRQEASYAYARQGNCTTIYLKTLKRLVLVSIIPFIALYFFAPILFAWAFGEQWRLSGSYAQILVPMLFLQFVTTPLSSMFIIAQKQQHDLIWQICLLVLVSMAFWNGYLHSSVEVALISFSSAYSLMYAINGLMTYRFAKNGTD
jgi:O-antigen/teichoic acid export membrane protein